MWSKAICWIDDCRIPFVDSDDIKSATPGSLNATGEFSLFGFKSGNQLNNQGRFPANILVSDDMLNDGLIYKSGKGHPHHKRNKTLGEYQGNAYGKFNNVNPQINYENYYGDKGTNSRYYDIDKWFDKIIE
jgi:hypothetical protein